MEEFKSLEDILNFAINEEIKASKLYAGLAQRSQNKEMAQIFNQFSREELGHKKKLENIKEGDKIVIEEKKVQDLKIGDYLVEVDKSRDDLNYQEALIVAMKEEKAAFKLYTDLAGKVDDAETKNVFLMLAQEEAKHKLRFEVEYDEYILKEN
ncbi:MAG: ferritin family protein [Bacteroidales bacterium]|nr:MAG: ferritin family protein [Bacteroidales bacterium]